MMRNSDSRNKKEKSQALSLFDRRKKLLERLKKRKTTKSSVLPNNSILDVSLANKKNKVRLAKKPLRSKHINSTPFDILFKSYDDYKPSITCNVVHVIESIGLGGAQTMMMEIVNALNKYYGQFVTNKVVYITNKNKKKDNSLFSSYGVSVDYVKLIDIKDYCNINKIDIVLHHRISQSECIKNYLPEKVKYILLNHTWHNIHKMSQFKKCDLYVSCCKFIHSKSPKDPFIHFSRQIVILNGVENDFIKNIEPKKLNGALITGRCHRMVDGKFKKDSLDWFVNVVKNKIPLVSHYIIGTNGDAERYSKKYPNTIFYSPSISERSEKISYIKSFDICFYETFGNEGASMAILESLSCGVPVICKNFGGNSEIVKDNICGFICKDRNDFFNKLIFFSNTKNLEEMKKKTLLYFENFMHVKFNVCKFMQCFEKLLQ